MKTVKFYTLGCKVNQYETQVIREQFDRAGFRETADSEPVAVYVINTCTVTHRADRRSLYLIRRAFYRNPQARIIVTGCLAQLDKDKIAAIHGVSLIVRNEDKSRIVALLSNSIENRRRQKAGCRQRRQESPPPKGGVPPEAARIKDQTGITYFKNHSRAFLKIQDGCNYNCSYCKVRLVRGTSRSRQLSEIKQEAAGLVRNGYLEIVLCGVCLGFYGRDLIPRLSLCEVIRELDKIPGRFRIRLSSLEVNDISDELINLMMESDRVCRHLHIPVQSGDGRILKLMRRAYSPAQYIKVIRRLRKSMPEIAITTDVMVGFPGETEESFSNTVELINKIRPSRVHIFPYSKRLNTPAYKFADFVSERKIKSRIADLERVVRVSRLTYWRMFVARICRVVIEKRVVGFPDLWQGYTDNYIRVRVRSVLELKNRIIQVRLKRVYNDFTLAEVCDEDANSHVSRNSLTLVETKSIIDFDV